MPQPRKSALSAALASAMAQAIEASSHAGAPAARIPGRIELVMAAAKSEADLFIYGDIGDSWWGESVTASDVVKQLNDLDDSVTTLNVYINSYGGSVSDGLSIYNALKRRSKAGLTVNTHVDGIAASIASLILCAGDKVTMASNTRLMVHAPWGGLYVTGNAREVREAAAEFAEVLDGFSDSMANSYAAKTGMSKDDALALLTDGADHWYSAAEARAAGFCDEIADGDDEEEAAAAATARLVAQPAFAKYFERMPTQLAAQLRAAAPQPSSQASARASQAAPSAATTREEPSMPQPKQPADTSATDTPQDVQAAMQALRDRNTAIRAAAAPHLGNAAVRAYVDEVLEAADPGVTAADANARILALLGQGRGPMNGGGHVVITQDERDSRRAAMSAALQARLGRPDANAMQGNPFANLSLSEMARSCAEAAGVDTRGMAAEQYIMAAITHTSSDFPLLVGNTFETALLRGFDSVPEVYDQITRTVPVANFNKQSLAGLGQFIGIEKVPEGDEYPYGTFTENGQEIQLTKRGAIFSITWEAIQGDRLGLFDSVPAKMGAGARRSLGDDVFAILTGNPVQGDGTALFHASRKNLAAPGTAMTTETLSAAFASMAVQTDKDGKVMRIPAKFVVVPVGMGAIARQILDSQFEVTSGKNSTMPNYMRGRFTVIEDPRLDIADPKAWYVVADTNVGDGLVIAALNGETRPTISQKEGWNVDGIEIKVRLAAAAGVVEPKALYKNPGPA